MKNEFLNYKCKILNDIIILLRKKHKIVECNSFVSLFAFNDHWQYFHSLLQRVNSQ